MRDQSLPTCEVPSGNTPQEHERTGPAGVADLHVATIALHPLIRVAVRV